MIKCCEPAIEMSEVDVVFGRFMNSKKALSLLDEGRGREDILAATNAVIGIASINLTVYGGEICVLIGLSGSGKSTLLRAINGLTRVTRGEILVRCAGEMVDVTKCNSRLIKKIRQRHISMVFQQFALFPWRTVRENVEFGLEIGGVSGNARKRIVDEQLEMVGLSQWENKFVSELSGGMQQRIGLSRALATEADILLMDEPFSALDPIMRAKLQDDLLELQKRLRRTIIFVSHDLNEALKIGSSVVVMEGGRISQCGTPEEIILSPASDYVREFVSNVSHLSVLTAHDIMRNFHDLKSVGDGWKCLEDGMTTCVKLDDDNKVIACEVDGRPSELLFCGDQDLPISPELKGDFIFLAHAELPLKTVVASMHIRPAPIGIVDSSGKFIGSVGVSDVFRVALKG